MVLILSTTTDYNTNYVIEWLRFYKIAFVRLSFENILEFENLYVINKKNIEITFTVDNKKYKLSDFKAFWYRRSQFDFSFKKTVGKNKILKQINNHLFYESTQIFKLFIKQLEKLAINKFKDVSLNKIEVLNNAVEIGLIVPFSLITQNKSDVLNFTLKHITTITKNFSQGVFINEKGKILVSKTQILTEKMFNNLPEKFSYSLFQEGINKQFELRIFFLNGKFKASAIFSQNDEKTSVDFRNYNFNKPNRTPPFKLPKEIELKLTKLMNCFNLNCGSIDMMVSTNNQYIFLEINPIGQYAQVSRPCNYNLDKLIAQQLIKITKNGVIKN